MMKTKIQIRKLYQNKRDKLSIGEIHKRSISLSNKCLKIPIWHMENFHIFLCLSNKNEIDTSPLLSIIMDKDKQVIVPNLYF